jgi:hypothetical protein
MIHTNACGPFLVFLGKTSPIYLPGRGKNQEECKLTATIWDIRMAFEVDVPVRGILVLLNLLIHIAVYKEASHCG